MASMVKVLFKTPAGGTASVREETPEQRREREKKETARARTVFGLTQAQRRTLSKAKASR